VVGSPDTGTVTFPVDGIYRSLYRGEASGYWRTWNDELVLYCANCAPPPQAVILPGDPELGALRVQPEDRDASGTRVPSGYLVASREHGSEGGRLGRDRRPEDADEQPSHHGENIARFMTPPSRSRVGVGRNLNGAPTSSPSVSTLETQGLQSRS
jgi:hypothetical protein